jgi:hypothetical protein
VAVAVLWQAGHAPFLFVYPDNSSSRSAVLISGPRHLQCIWGSVPLGLFITLNLEASWCPGLLRTFCERQEWHCQHTGPTPQLTILDHPRCRQSEVLVSSEKGSGERFCLQLWQPGETEAGGGWWLLGGPQALASSGGEGVLS